MSTNEHIKALREVHEAARQFLRFRGVDKTRCDHALERLVDATEAAKDLDGGSEPEPKPIDMVLRCPACLEQHIDAVEYGPDGAITWPNEPHRSHLCHECGHVWRPADVPTNGVLRTKTHGKDDMVMFDGPADELRRLRLEESLRNPPQLQWHGEQP